MLRRRFLSAGEVIPKYEYTMKIGYYNDKPIPFLGGYYKHSNLNLIGTLAEGGAFSLLKQSFADSYGEYIISSEAPDLGMFVSVEGNSLYDPEKGYAGGLLRGGYITYFPEDAYGNIQGTVWEEGLSVDSLILDGDIQTIYQGFDDYILDLGGLGHNVSALTLPKSLRKIGPSALVSWKQLTSLEIPENVINLGNSCLPATTDSNFRTLILKPITPPASSNLFYDLPEDFKIRVYADCVDTYKNDDYYKYYADYIDTINDTIISYRNGTRYSTINYKFSTSKSVESGDCDSWSEEIYLPNSIEIIKAGAFHNYTHLQKIQLPNNLQEIEGFTGYGTLKAGFSQCTSLQNVVFPDSLIKLGKYAFNGCKSLTEVTIPINVQEIELYCFSDCPNIKKITLYSPFYQVDTTTLDQIFEDCQLETIVIGKIGEITGNHFGNTASTVKNLIIEDGITSIADYSFHYFPQLKNITLSSNVTNIGYRAFPDYEDCVINYTGTLEDWLRANYDLIYFRQVLIQGEPITDLIIPTDITVVRAEAFREGVFNSVTIPEHVTEIEPNAFVSSVTQEFNYNANIDVTKGPMGIGVYKTVNIQEGVENIPYNLCQVANGCNVYLPSSVKTICSYSFGNPAYNTPFNLFYTGSLENYLSMSFLGNVAQWTLYGINLYINNELLTHLDIPETVTTIGRSQFLAVNSLSSVNIPVSVTTLSLTCFAYCSNLQTVNYNGTIEQWNAIIKESNLDASWNIGAAFRVIHCTDGDVELYA